MILRKNSLLNLSVISGSSHPRLAKDICNLINQDLRQENNEEEYGLTESRLEQGVFVQTELRKFPNDESHVKICQSIRRQHVVIIQTSSPPVNDHFVELLMLADAAKRASADEITAVIPHFFYTRSDKKDEPRISITASLVAKLLKEAGVNRIVAIELHSPQTQGYFDIFDNFYAGQFFCNEIKGRFRVNSENKDNYVTAAFDLGASKLNRNLAEKMGLRCGAIIDKDRIDSYTVDGQAFVGNVEGKIVFAFDDEFLTGGTTLTGSKILKEKGAKEVHACVFHPAGTEKAIERIEASDDIDSVIVMDTMPFYYYGSKIIIIQCALLLADVIKRVHIGESVSSLF